MRPPHTQHGRRRSSSSATPSERPKRQREVPACQVNGRRAAAGSVQLGESGASMPLGWRADAAVLLHGPFRGGAHPHTAVVGHHRHRLHALARAASQRGPIGGPHRRRRRLAGGIVARRRRTGRGRHRGLRDTQDAAAQGHPRFGDRGPALARVARATRCPHRPRTDHRRGHLANPRFAARYRANDEGS